MDISRKNTLFDSSDCDKPVILPDPHRKLTDRNATYHSTPPPPFKFFKHCFSSKLM